MIEQNLITYDQFQVGQNPYILIPDKYLQMISEHREVVITTSNYAQELFDLDKILPETIEHLFKYHFEIVDKLEFPDVIIYGAIYGVDYTRIKTKSVYEISCYTLIWLYLTYEYSFNYIEPLVDKLSRRSLESIGIKLGVPVKVSKVLDISDIIDIIKTKEFNPSNLEELIDAGDRFEYLTTHQYAHLFYVMYPDLIKASFEKPIRIEELIDKLSDDTAEEISQELGMLIPNIYQKDLTRYIEHNIISYSHRYDKSPRIKPNIMVLSEKLAKNPSSLATGFIYRLSDSEIMDYTGFYIPYRNRDELIDKSIDLLHYETFMYPLSNNFRYSINDESLFGTPVSEIKHPICYGTAVKYYTFEVEELYNAFFTDEDGTVEFRHPEDLSAVYSIEEIKELLNLLERFSNHKEFPKLIDRINDIIIKHHEMDEYDEQLFERFSEFDEIEKDYIREVLFKIFETGMYMRRWKGPGYPYPLLSYETKTTSDVFMIKLSEEINKLRTLIGDLSDDIQEFILSMRIYKYNNGHELNRSHIQFGDEWTLILKEASCIRVASAYFVGTGFHFLRVFFNETISGVDDTKIDSIV